MLTEMRATISNKFMGSGTNYKSKNLERYISSKISLPTDKEIVFLCIGTDRSTGDSFGPFVGTNLKQCIDAEVLGTLEKPVHAENLIDKVKCIDPKAFIIAIDATLGDACAIENIKCIKTGITPGSAVGNDLSLVGDAAILGVVNAYTDDDSINHMCLASTRLYTVISMAETIAKCIEFIWNQRSMGSLPSIRRVK